MPVIRGIEFAGVGWDQSHQTMDAVMDLELSEMAFAGADLDRWIQEHQVAVVAMAHKSASAEVVQD